MPKESKLESSRIMSPRSGELPIPSMSAIRKVMRSEDLLEGRRDLMILHGKEEYRLRVTRNGKLILTK